MAQSPSHRLGQMIGDFLEDLILPLLENFCLTHENCGLYLDRKGERPARSGKKLIWLDRCGSAHDLDFVIERGGTPSKLGQPVAFIEAAWRRYPKHSKNKAQEIQGALIPIAEKYAWDTPFLGAFLAGVFTDPAVEQMKGAGFVVSLFPYDTLVKAFAAAGVNIDFDEAATDERFEEIIGAVESLDERSLNEVKATLMSLNRSQIDEFFTALERAATKAVERLILTPLYGKAHEFRSIDELATFVREYDGEETGLNLIKYEIFVRYTNGSEIRSQFKEKEEIYDFLDYIARAAGRFPA